MRKLLLGLIGLLFAVPAVAADLPSGYTELEYIESTGTQWIDTGIKWRYGYSLEMAFTAIQTGPNTAIFGASNGAAYNNGEVALFFQRDGYDVIWPTTDSMTSTFQHFGTFALNTKYVARYNNSGITIGQNTLEFSVYSGYVCERNLFLFAANRGEANKYPSQVKIHSTQIWDNNNTLVRNMIPAKRNSDNAIGMYDTVSGTFFTNAGTGEFIAGPVIPEQQIRIATTAYNSARFSPVVTELNDTIATIRSVVTNTINQTKAIADLQATKQTRPNENCPAGKKCLLVEDNDGQPHWYEIIESASRLPAGYTELEYIEGTGTQYIDTGYPVNNNVSAKMKIMRTAADGNSALFGYRFVPTASAVGNMRFVFLYADNKVGLRTGVNTTNSTQSISLNQDYVIEYALDSVKVNNVKWVSSSESYSTTSFGNGYLFSTNTEGYASSDINNFVGRIYYFEEMDNGNLVRNLIPVKNSSGVVGMYDLVSGQFFTNQGTGSFIAGPEI